LGEKRAEFPLWLEYSGLPELINTRIRKGAWSVFKKVVELDCAVNVDPGVVSISLRELAERTGLSPEIVQRCLNGLRKKKIVACFIPDNFEENALLRIVVPLKTPLSPDKVKKEKSDLFPPGEDFFRYFDHRAIEPQDDEILQEIIDLYFNSLGLKMNLFILDELRLIRQISNLSDIRRVFETARRLEIKSLRWVMRQLLSGRKKDGKRKRRKKKKTV
jgi:hypothetical protein